jgi:hypothetical protein
MNKKIEIDLHEDKRKVWNLSPTSFFVLFCFTRASSHIMFRIFRFVLLPLLKRTYLNVFHVELSKSCLKVFFLLSFAFHFSIRYPIIRGWSPRVLLHDTSKEKLQVLLISIKNKFCVNIETFLVGCKFASVCDESIKVPAHKCRNCSIKKLLRWRIHVLRRFSQHTINLV